MLSNLYFRRFMLAWYGHGYAKKLQAEVVNYADDFVILCPEGNGAQAMEAMRGLMTRLGLTVNEKKTRLVKPVTQSTGHVPANTGQNHIDRKPNTLSVQHGHWVVFKSGTLAHADNQPS